MEKEATVTVINDEPASCLLTIPPNAQKSIAVAAIAAIKMV